MDKKQLNLLLVLIFLFMMSTIAVTFLPLKILFSCITTCIGIFYARALRKSSEK
ncbi:hypothetical protein A5880_001723 [Enterococcus sp. 4G2_DIV0659]|uniref:Uncharacterized protein n=1 Tax=Candidatus Enterococcus mansonii TaxID=1834181 RepID=A0A242CEH8_9ENTE|nr:hypothetical protein A5880_001643 [Enterococcus sp. 4G2_DIV0659]